MCRIKRDYKTYKSLQGSSELFQIIDLKILENSYGWRREQE